MRNLRLHMVAVLCGLLLAVPLTVCADGGDSSDNPFNSCYAASGKGVASCLSRCNSPKADWSA